MSSGLGVGGPQGPAQTLSLAFLQGPLGTPGADLAPRTCLPPSLPSHTRDLFLVLLHLSWTVLLWPPLFWNFFLSVFSSPL